LLNIFFCEFSRIAR